MNNYYRVCFNTLVHGQRRLASRLLRSAALSGLAVIGLAGCAVASPDSVGSAGSAAGSAVAAAESVDKTVAPAPRVSMGNGDKNWIVVEGVTRDNNVLRFEEVRIDGNGWLVMHPFENGRPNGDKYVASTYVASGINKDVEIEVLKGVDAGEMFIVMLHRDLNENKVLDFVFVDDRNVMDKAVFEGTTMIGHAIPAP